MSRSSVYLALVLFAVALLVIETRHQNRMLYTQLQNLRAERDALNTEWERLLLEEGTWAQHQRVDLAARTLLNMNIPERDRINVVRMDGAP